MELQRLNVYDVLQSLPLYGFPRRHTIYISNDKLASDLVRIADERECRMQEDVLDRPRKIHGITLAELRAFRKAAELLLRS